MLFRSRAAADLEGHIQHKLPLGDVWLQLSRMVSRTLAAAQHEWETLRLEQAANEPAPQAPAAGSGLDDEQWQLLLQGLVTSLRQGEYPEGPWLMANAQGGARFGAATWSSLALAIDDFDFDAAADRVEALLQQLRATVE